MTLDPTTKKAALFSGLLHLSTLLFLILGVLFSNLFARDEEPYIFEMVALPESIEAFEPETFEPLPEVSLDIEEFAEPEFIPVEEPPLKPFEQPKPKLVQEKPKPKIITYDEFVKQHEKPEPEFIPVEEPTLKPVGQPKPKPVQEKPKPKIITYDEFVKQHGKPEPPAEMPKPKPKRARPIDTLKIEKNLRQSIMSVPELSLTTSSVAEDTDAMRVWRSLLAGRLDALWKQSETQGTAGRSVKVSFYISAGGAISSVRVVQSSGIGELDSIGVSTVHRLGNFQPPPSGSGETVMVLFKVE